MRGEGRGEREREGGRGGELVKLRANNLQILNVFWMRCSFLIRRSQQRQQQHAADQRRLATPPPRLACPLCWAWHIKSHSGRPCGERKYYLKTVFNLPVNLIAPGMAPRWQVGVELGALGRPYLAFLVPPLPTYLFFATSTCRCWRWHCSRTRRLIPFFTSSYNCIYFHYFKHTPAHPRTPLQTPALPLHTPAQLCPPLVCPCTLRQIEFKIENREKIKGKRKGGRRIKEYRQLAYTLCQRQKAEL